MKNLKEKTPLVLSVVVLILAAVAFCAGVFLDLNSNQTLQSKSNNLPNTILPSFLTFASIWFMGYFIHFQLYRDRYPSQMLKDYYEPVAKSTIAGIALITVFGACSIALDKQYSQSIFVAVSLIYTLLLLIQAFYTNRSFMLSTYIKKYTDSIIAEIKSDCKTPNNSHGALEKLTDIFCESLAQGEYYVCLIIHEQLSNTFQAQLEVCNKKLLSSSSVDEVCSDFEAIVRSMLYQTRQLSDDFPGHFLTQIVAFQVNNIKNCIATGHYDLYKLYITEILQLSCATANNKKRGIQRQCYAILAKAILSCMSDKRSDYLNYCLDQCEQLAMSVRFVENIFSLDDCILMLASVLCSESNPEESRGYSVVFDSFLRCSTFTAKITGNFKTISKYHLAVFYSITSRKQDGLIDDYLTFLRDTYRYLSEDDTWTNCVYHFLTDLETKSCEERIQTINALKVHVLSEIIHSQRDLSTLLLPNYPQMISNTSTSDRKKIITSIVDDYSSLIRKSINKNKLSITYFLYEELHKCFFSLEENHRNAQEQLLNIFFDTLSYTLHLDDKPSFELCLDSLEKCLREMDKESLISENLGRIILNKLFCLAEPESNQDEVLRALLIETLYGFMKEDTEMVFILKKQDAYKRYYNSWLDIGIRCLEEGNESLLRRVSGSIGWLLIYALKRNGRNEIDILIKTAIKLHSYSSSFELSKNTRIFLLTLFTVVGSYCSKETYLYPYRKQIVQYISGLEYQMIEMATEIRISEESTWEETFGTSALPYSDNFLKEVKKQKERLSKQH